MWPIYILPVSMWSCLWSVGMHLTGIVRSFLHRSDMFCHRLNQWQQHNAHLSTGKYSFMQCDYWREKMCSPRVLGAFWRRTPGATIKSSSPLYGAKSKPPLAPLCTQYWMDEITSWANINCQSALLFRWDCDASLVIVCRWNELCVVLSGKFISEFGSQPVLSSVYCSVVAESVCVIHELAPCCISDDQGLIINSLLPRNFYGIAIVVPWYVVRSLIGFQLASALLPRII